LHEVLPLLAEAEASNQEGIDREREESCLGLLVIFIAWVAHNIKWNDWIAEEGIVLVETLGKYQELQVLKEIYGLVFSLERFKELWEEFLRELYQNLLDSCWGELLVSLL